MARPIVLSGFMATGKSTIGPRVAARLQWPFVDTDDLLATEAGCTVGELWSQIGEAAFREREARHVRKLLASPTPHVIAFGGGVVTMRDIRHLALDAAIVITLTASPDTIVSRSGNIHSRPNLQATDPRARAAMLLDLRREAYAECHLRLSTDDLTPDEAADAIVALAARDPLAVPLGERTYQVDFVHNSPRALTDALARLGPSSLLTVSDSHVRRARAVALEQSLAPLAMPKKEVVLAPGEEQKNLASVATIWDAALGTDIDRDAVVLAFGGGVVGDLAGFAAATVLRGVRFVQAPTTLLAMVDSSVGGKTGFDHLSGKNLIGAFHQPSAVVVDVEHLSTLPARELAAGFAEIVKIALAYDRALFERLEEQAALLASGNREALLPVIRHAVEAKARVVRDDEREAGLRAILNLGHTVGHALEAFGEFARWIHGEAVALGTLAELAFGVQHGTTPASLVPRVRALLEKFHLPIQCEPAALAQSARFIATDKKRAGDRVRLPLVTGVGRTELVSVTQRDLVSYLSSQLATF